MPYAHAAAGKNIKTVTVNWNKQRKLKSSFVTEEAAKSHLCVASFVLLQCGSCLSACLWLIVTEEETINERVNILSF